MYFENEWKSPKLAHFVASGVSVGKPSDTCEACGSMALKYCPTFGEFFCDGSIEGFERCTNHIPVNGTKVDPVWVVPKSAAKPSSPIRTFVHPTPGIAPELAFEGAAKGKATAVTAKKGAAKGGYSAAVTAAAMASADPVAGAKRSHTLVDPESSEMAATAVAPNALDLVGRELSGVSVFFQGRFKGGRLPLIRIITSKAGQVVSAANRATHVVVPPDTETVSKALQTVLDSNQKVRIVFGPCAFSFMRLLPCDRLQADMSLTVVISRSSRSFQQILFSTLSLAGGLQLGLPSLGTCCLIHVPGGTLLQRWRQCRVLRKRPVLTTSPAVQILYLHLPSVEKCRTSSWQLIPSVDQEVRF